MLVTMLAAFLVLMLGLFALFSGLDRRNQQARNLRERLFALDRAMQRHESEELALLRNELVSSVPALNNLLLNSPAIARLQTRLSQAAMGIRAGKFLLAAVCSGSAAALVVSQLVDGFVMPLLAFVVGAYIPFAVMEIRRGRRFRKFENMLPEAIELLSRAVRAGHSFSSSLELIATEMGDPLGTEFRKIYEEQKFGLPIRDALLNFAERVPTVDVRFFVTAVLMQRDTGGNLAEILDKLSYLIRERFKILRQVRVYTAQGRLTMWILLSLPPALGVMMSRMSPQIFNRMFTDPLGHLLLAMSLIMETIGFFFIRKIVHIQV
ncbi:MAG: type II secretion system F family protein [Terriglobales bacterium]